MIDVFIPKDKEFKKYEKECKELYESVQDKICDPNTFEFIKKNTLFYMFVNGGILIGGIYYFLDEEGRLFLNAFAKRKMHQKCIECLKMSLDWFKGSIYAEAQNRASALCLLKCGFRRQDGNIFVYKNTVQKIMNEHYGKTNNGWSNCPGYINVSSYTRAGKEVSGYTRNCPYH